MDPAKLTTWLDPAQSTSVALGLKGLGELVVFNISHWLIGLVRVW